MLAHFFEKSSLVPNSQDWILYTARFFHNLSDPGSHGHEKMPAIRFSSVPSCGFASTQTISTAPPRLTDSVLFSENKNCVNVIWLHNKFLCPDTWEMLWYFHQSTFCNPPIYIQISCFPKDTFLFPRTDGYKIVVWIGIVIIFHSRMFAGREPI